jgi:hypothetical protein
LDAIPALDHSPSIIQAWIAIVRFGEPHRFASSKFFSIERASDVDLTNGPIFFCAQASSPETG